mgnify:CR=1 FL=1
MKNLNLKRTLITSVIALVILAIIGLAFAKKKMIIMKPKYVKGELIVKFKPSMGKEAFNATAAKIRAEKIAYFSNVDAFHLKLPKDLKVEEAIKMLKDDPSVEYAEPNFIYRSAILPSDTLFTNQWHLKKIKATDAWDKARESTDVVIAIIDSGVNVNHPDLRENIWLNRREIANNKIDDDGNGYADDIQGWDFVNDVSDPGPKFEDGFTEEGVNHGTLVAGVAGAAGNNASGISGITWKVQIMPLKVLDDKGEGNTSDVIEAMDYAIHNGADVINFSFVGFGYSISMEKAIKRAYDAGIIVVSAAGNEQENGDGYFLDEKPMYPVCHDGPNGENWVIGVAATDSLDQKAKFSSYGFKCIDIAAPGVSIFSTVVYNPSQSIGNQAFNKYYDGYYSGTSMAAPMVSGAVALIKGANPGLTRKEAVEVLLNGSDNIYRVNPGLLGQIGRGRLNINNSLELALSKLANIDSRMILTPKSGALSEISFASINGPEAATGTPPAYGPDFFAGVEIAAGDIDGDGKDEIITGPGPGGGPHIKIFNDNFALKGQFFAYAPSFRGGVMVASGDVNGDGKDEIITGAGPGGGPHVRVFDARGKLLLQFFAYAPSFKGGVTVASGDINGDGKDEIITGAGPGGGPHVRVFDGKGSEVMQFFAYDKSFRGGIKPAFGKVTSKNGKANIITVPMSKSESRIRVFDKTGRQVAEWLAFHSKFKGGASIAASDMDNDGLDEIIVGAGPGGAPHVRVFEGDGFVSGSFYAFKEDFKGGVNVSGFALKKEAKLFQ